MADRLSQSKICPECKKESFYFTAGICHNCWRRNHWNREKKICSRCRRLIPIKGKGMCGGCYNTTFYLDYTKAKNQMKLYGLDYEIYKKITERCVLCGFDKFVALHHLDQDKSNNTLNNLIGLCPNHHQMLHTLKYREEIFQALREKGFNPQHKKPRTDIKGSY